MEEVRIERLGARGDGIAEGPLYVPRVLPEELVSGRRVGDRLEDVRILTPSPDRVRPPCPHYGACGGCQLQHASDAFLADWKRERVIAALGQHGLAAEVRAVETSPPASRRRATVAAKRLKSGVVVGFHGLRSGTIAEVPGCLLIRPELVAALPAVREMAAAGLSRKGELKATVTLSEAGIDLAATGGKALDLTLRERLAAIAAAHDLARLSWGEETVALCRPPVQRMGRARVVPPPGAFLQATAEGEAALITAVREIVGPARRIVDLFAGCGTFALALAESAEVHAVEAGREMLAALEAGWRGATGLRRVTTEPRDLFRNPLRADELGRFEAVVLDPPRAGAAAQVAQIAESPAGVVAMVSCNPATFARDARTLVDAGFAMGPVSVIDQFRWSAHVELVAGFRRERG